MDWVRPPVIVDEMLPVASVATSKAPVSRVPPESVTLPRAICIAAADCDPLTVTV
jgi:hypothetical protein